MKMMNLKVFLSLKNCQQCGKPLDARIMSFFFDRTICLECSAKEDAIKAQLEAQGKNPRHYEGCGYTPKV